MTEPANLGQNDSSVPDQRLSGSDVLVRFCPQGRLTFDKRRTFKRVPQRGETIIEPDERGDVERYVVVEIDWQENGSPFIIAHDYRRPRSEAALPLDRGDESDV